MKQLLCYGDSNTWGLIPGTHDRYPEGVRWSSILSGLLEKKNIKVIEEGLCGRTTIFEDEYRDGRNGFETLSDVINSAGKLDGAVIMLGTNDCKTFFGASAQEIAEGMEKCIDLLLSFIPADSILLVSPIYLGEGVWEEDADPEFGRESVLTSRNLNREYKKVAQKKKIHIIDASDYANPSDRDREHLTERGHLLLADSIYNALLHMKILKD